MAAYYLSHQNLEEIGEQVFGDDIRGLKLIYIKKNRLWYRLLPTEVIQFIGFKQYSQGFYDINIAAQPLYVPLYDLSSDWLKKGEVPCHLCYDDISRIYWRMEMLSMVSPYKVPRLTGHKTDPLDFILRHMRGTYETIARPVLYYAIDPASCYACYQRVKNIWIETARSSMGNEQAEVEKKKSNLFEVLILGGNNRFQEAKRAYEIDKELFPEYTDGRFPHEYMIALENNDEEGFVKILEQTRENNMKMLKRHGLL